MSYSIIIPSKNVTNLAACIGALRAAGEMARVIVVDDGVDWNGSEWGRDAEHEALVGI